MISIEKKNLFLMFLLAGGLVFLTSQSQGQGFFGKKRNQEAAAHLTSDTMSLFPGPETSSTPSAPVPSAGMAIFKDGKPQEVKETAYTIQNGQRVPAEMPKEKEHGKLFHGMLKKEDRPREVPTFNPAPLVPPVAETPKKIEESAVEKERWINLPKPKLPFIKSKHDSTLPGQEGGEGDGLVAAAQVPHKPAPAIPQPAPAASPSQDGAERDHWLNLPKPKLPFIKPKQDSVLPGQGTDILVNDGSGLVAAAEPLQKIGPVVSQPSPAATPPSSPGAKPKKDDTGTVIYSSWDEVQAKKTTVADKIVQDMRSQEAAQKQKIAEAQRQYEQQIAKAREEAKKAEEAARMRAMLNGMMQQPGGAPGPGGL